MIEVYSKKEQKYIMILEESDDYISQKDWDTYYWDKISEEETYIPRRWLKMEFIIKFIGNIETENMEQAEKVMYEILKELDTKFEEYSASLEESKDY